MNNINEMKSGHMTLVRKRLVSERAGLAAVCGALVLSLGLSAASVWTSAGRVEAMQVAAQHPAGSTAVARLARANVRMPVPPRWQQHFFDFDRNNARVASRIVLQANRYVI